jgi:hypothetical protein
MCDYLLDRSEMEKMYENESGDDDDDDDDDDDGETEGETENKSGQAAGDDGWEGNIFYDEVCVYLRLFYL